jgi:Ca2+-binding RTX toxin-like protein
MGQSGNDTISVEVPARQALLYGGVGNDTLSAGNQHSALVGGFGNDTLIGGAGKDILIGGAGKDTIEGGNGGDALIAGSSAYDSTQAPAREVLCEVLEDWAHAGHAFDSVMNATTLFDDGEVDNLLGQKGNDLFIMNISNGTILDISDATKTEEVTDLL